MAMPSGESLKLVCLPRNPEFQNFRTSFGSILGLRKWTTYPQIGPRPPSYIIFQYWAIREFANGWKHAATMLAYVGNISGLFFSFVVQRILQTEWHTSTHQNLRTPDRQSQVVLKIIFHEVWSSLCVAAIPAPCCCGRMNPTLSPIAQFSQDWNAVYDLGNMVRFEGTLSTSGGPKCYQNWSENFEIQDSSEDIRVWAIPRSASPSAQNHVRGVISRAKTQGYLGFFGKQFT